MSHSSSSPQQSFLARWLVLWLCLSSLLAFYWPTWFPVVVDPFAASKPTIPYQIALIMFCIGCLLPKDGLVPIGKRWWMVLAGTTLQYLIMPGLAYFLAVLFDLKGDAYIGVIMVGCVPGAMASNVLTVTAGGDVSYSISLTTLATLLSPLVVPVILFLTLGEAAGAEILWNTFLMLLLTVVLPVLVGHGLCRVWPLFDRWMSILGAIIANLVILWLIAVVVALNRERLGSAQVMLMGLLLILNILGYLCGYFGAAVLGMPESMRRALTIEIGMQNAGLGTAIVTQLFKGHDEAAIAPALYTFGCMLTGALLARIWAARSLSGPDPS